MHEIRLPALSIFVVVSFGCGRAAVAPAAAVHEPIVIVPPPAQAGSEPVAIVPSQGQPKSDAGAAASPRGASTERYVIAISKRSRIDGAAEPTRVDLLSKRLLTVDLWLKTLETSDDRIRVSTGFVDGKPQWQSYDVRVRSRARGAVRAEGGADEQRTFAEQMLGLLQALVPERHSTEQLQLGASWDAQYRQSLSYGDALLDIHHELKFRKLPMTEVAGDSAIEVELRGSLRTDPVAVRGRRLVGVGFLIGTARLGPWEQSGGAVRMELVLRDATTGAQVGRIAEHIGYSALRSDHGTEDIAVARAAYEAEHPGDCRNALVSLSAPGEVAVTLTPRDGVAADLTFSALDVDPKTRERLSAALIARRNDFMACTPTRASSGLTLDLSSRPFTARAPYNLTPAQTACIVTLSQRSLEQLDLGNARRIVLNFAASRPEAADAPTADKTAEPGVPKAEIRKVIEGHGDEVRACYERALDGWPELAGRVTVRFGIAADGSVLFAVPVRPDVGPAALGCCVVEALKSWQFPVAKDGRLTLVKYPWMLESTSK